MVRTGTVVRLCWHGYWTGIDMGSTTQLDNELEHALVFTLNLQETFLPLRFTYNPQCQIHYDTVLDKRLPLHNALT